MSINKWIEQNIPRKEGRRILITGANSGLGYEATQILLSQGAEVIMACRNPQKAQKAISALLAKFPQAKVSFLPYDQASLSSIHEAAEMLKRDYQHLDVVIFNAGVYHPKSGSETVDGFPYTIGVNYLGAYRFYQEIHSLVEASSTGRCIFVSSLTYKHAHLDDLSFLRQTERKQTYSYRCSKGAIATWFDYLSRHANHLVYLMHPGVTSTNIYSSGNTSFPRWFMRLAHLVLPLFTHSPKKACLGMVYLALVDDLPSGTVLGPRGPWEIAGYPKPRKLPKRLIKHEEALIQETEMILKGGEKHA